MTATPSATGRDRPAATILQRRIDIQFRKPDGGLYTEQLFSTRGFSGPMSTLYHINQPTEVSG